MKQLLFVMVATAVAFCSNATAQSKLELQPDDTMRSVLDRHVGQTVDLRLKSGEKLGGRLEKVTEKLAHLSQLSGAEYFDGVVDLTEVAAVAVRAKK